MRFAGFALSVVFAAGSIVLTAPAQAQDASAACAGVPDRMQLICSGEGCLRVEARRVCEIAQAGRARPSASVRPKSLEERAQRDLDRLIASLN